MTGILLLMLLIIVAHFLLADKEHPLTIKQGEASKILNKYRNAAPKKPCFGHDVNSLQKM